MAAWLKSLFKKKPKTRELEFTYQFSLLNIETSYNVGFAKGRLKGAEEFATLMMAAMHYGEFDKKKVQEALNFNLKMLSDNTKSLCDAYLNRRVSMEEQLKQENFKETPA